MNNIFDDWAWDWKIDPKAIDDLRMRLAEPDYCESQINVRNETGLLQLVKLEASKKGARLWRNNTGACYAMNGAFIRYGLANETTQMNKTIKSADLIGIKPIRITEDYLGKTVGQFYSREGKTAGWHYKHTETERAQLAWIELINGLGGDAAFITTKK